MSEISKAYEPQSVEEKWYDFWVKNDCFTADPERVSDKRPAYSIVIPPPNVTGMLHMGHVLNNTIQDILARKARMDGKEVLWLPGMDHAGIATQVQVEKALKKEERLTKHDLGREEFLKRVWTWKEKHGGIIINQLKKLGCSCDWTRERFTMDEDYSRCVQKVFVELYKKGLIYRGKRMVNWCPASLTALSDEEVEMEPQKSFLYYFKVEVSEEPGTFLTIATTRPETIPGDTAIAVNPKDERYAHLIGKHAIRPLPIQLPQEKKLIPIIGDEHVDFEFGTGVLKVTPAHDKADFEIGQRHQLPIVDIMNPNGTMNDLAGETLAGLDRFEARAAAIERLRELDVLVKEEPYENKVGFSQRARVPIEPRLSEQWFLKYPCVEQAKACVEQASTSEGRVTRAPNLSDKTVRVVPVTGKEFPGSSIHELRKSALIYARQHGILGVPFKNEDSGIQIRIGRQSLSHAFSHIGVANILAVAVLPELIRTAVWISSQPHEPHNPMVKQVHRFIAALSLAGELHRVVITAKEFYDGTVLYDHRTKKITFGGKSLEAHLPKEKLDTQPAPNAEVKVGRLLAGVNVSNMRFYPERWSKVYDHWLTNIQDWCVSRQLWWGHRIPVWSKSYDCYNLCSVYTDVSDVLAPPPSMDHRFVGVDSPDIAVVIDGNPVTADSKKLLEQGLQLQESNPEIRPIIAHVCSIDEELTKRLKSDSWEQDPDVLDTWFSSWLWPFATMGWPEQTETLKKFYPTTDLVTAPDIIFFWVARMIMAGYEFMGDPKFSLPDAMPFKNVYFTGIIRDKQGRKMSKSLGNSPDPLELIAKYGADALRFGTMRSAPLGTDVLFDEKDVELGRNFCNKLWNACRFRQMQGSAAVPAAQGEGEGAEGRQDSDKSRADACAPFEIQGEIKPDLLTTDDKWILMRLDLAIREISEAFASYNFAIAAQTIYRFFWSEYCDWYVEASKAVLQGEDEERKANTLAVIDFVLSHLLRVFHPFLPFVSEELWHGMGYSVDMPNDQGGQTIMNAPWPKPFEKELLENYGLDETAATLAEARFELVRAGRNLRREANLQSKKKVPYVLKPHGELDALDVEVMRLLLNAETLELSPDFAPSKGTLTAHTPVGELFLPMEGLVDVEAEKARLTKELTKIAAEVGKVEQKLNNENFVNKVPAKVLEEHKQRLADWQEKEEHAKAALKAVG